METKNTEQNKIKQVAKDYEKNGYSVVIEPHGSNIPSFIKGYRPDIIAMSDNDNVVIEVKTRADLSTIERLKDIADVINKRENWRFELIVTTTKQEAKTETTRLNVDLDLSEIKRNLEQVKKLAEQDLLTAAFVLCWANMESISRQLLLEDKKNLSNKTPLALIKTLFSFGYLNRTDLESLEKLFQTRNLLVHGYKATNLDRKTLDKLIAISDKLILEKEKIDNE
jgi:uncharacterized protein YutE (UPF0331/DUF86 family)